MTKRLDEKGRLLLLTSLRASRICRDNLLLEWHNRNQNIKTLIIVFRCLMLLESSFLLSYSRSRQASLDSYNLGMGLLRPYSVRLYSIAAGLGAATTISDVYPNTLFVVHSNTFHSSLDMYSVSCTGRQPPNKIGNRWTVHSHNPITIREAILVVGFVMLTSTNRPSSSFWFIKDLSAFFKNV